MVGRRLRRTNRFPDVGFKQEARELKGPTNQARPTQQLRGVTIIGALMITLIEGCRERAGLQVAWSERSVRGGRNRLGNHLCTIFEEFVRFGHVD
jgi:hypothetical protein